MLSAGAPPSTRGVGRDDRFWLEIRNEVYRLHNEHSEAVGARVQRVEAAATQIANGHSQLAHRIGGIEPWVQHWADESRDGGR